MKLKKDDFIFKNRYNEILIKEPGQINGIEFRLKDVHDCIVYLFDHTATIYIDKCTNTKFYIGPVKGSIFIRDCSDCDISVACQQFRCRNLYDSNVYLYAQNNPIIESSQGLKFAPYNLAYPLLDKHAAAACLSTDQNKWSQIYDFTKVEDTYCYQQYMKHKNYDIPEANYSLMEPYEWKMNKIPVQGMYDKPVVAFRYPANYGGSIPDFASLGAYQHEELSDDQILEFDSSDKKTFKRRRNSSPMRVTMNEDNSEKYTSFASTVQKVQQNEGLFTLQQMQME